MSEQPPFAGKSISFGLEKMVGFALALPTLHNHHQILIRYIIWNILINRLNPVNLKNPFSSQVG